MATIIIVLSDAGNGLVNYKSACQTPDDTDENVEPTLALKLAVKIIDEIVSISKNNEVE
jgi:hypothetical protein